MVLGRYSTQLGDLVDDTFDISLKVEDLVLVTKISGNLNLCYLSGRSCQTGRESYLVVDLMNAERNRWIWPKFVSDLSSGSQIHLSSSLTCHSCEVTLEVVTQNSKGGAS